MYPGYMQEEGKKVYQTTSLMLTTVCFSFSACSATILTVTSKFTFIANAVNESFVLLVHLICRYKAHMVYSWICCCFY